MKVFICPGKFLYKDIKRVSDELNGVLIVGVLASSNTIKSDWNSEKTGIETWTKKALIKENPHFSFTPFHEHYEDLLSKILNDPRAMYLAERVLTNGIFLGYDSVFNHTIKIEIAVWNSLAILWKTKPDRILVPSTPHSLTWFFVRTAELLGIEVLLKAEAPLKWKSWLVKGMDEQIPLELKKVGSDNTSEEKIVEYMRKVRSDYDHAIPDYERIPLEKFKKKEGSLTGEFKSIFSENGMRAKLSKLKSAIEKREMLKLYSSLTANFQIPNKYVVYFLHFQPERTTLPEAQEFVQQWKAVRVLSESLPKGYKLVVKEHPSTYRNHFSKKVRDPNFYKSLSSLKNVLLAPIRLTPFKLIDQSVAVATCTGTVGIEAIIRGKPVLVFGVAQYRGLKSVFSVKSINDVRSSLNVIFNDFETPSETDLMNYLKWVDKNSFENHTESFSSFGGEAMIHALKYKKHLQLNQLEK